jgi:alpha-L-rhamnosidase
MPLEKAVPIAADSDFNGAPLIRCEVALDSGHGAVKSAQLHATSFGIFHAFIGPNLVSDELFAPGWSSYEWRLRYHTYSVTNLISETRFVLGFALGNGWWRGKLGWSGRSAFYGDQLAVVAELHIEFADGHVQNVVTDATSGAWRAGGSEVLANDFYDGQTIDARLRDVSWLQIGAKLDGWTGVHALPLDRGILAPQAGPPILRHESLVPRKIWTSPAGKTLVDFDQNLVGCIRCQVKGERGKEIVLRHAEVLEDAELGTRPLRAAKATDRFILSG